MTYKEQLDKMADFTRVLDQTDTPAEFMLMCTINGFGYMASREFFDGALFGFMYGPPASTRYEILKARSALLSNAVKLHEIYRILPECCDEDALRDLVGSEN